MKRMRTEDGGFALEAAILTGAWLMVIWLLVAAIRLHHSSLAVASAAAASAQAGASQNVAVSVEELLDGIATTGCSSLELTLTETQAGAQMLSNAEVECIRHAVQADRILGGGVEDNVGWEQPAWPIAPD